MVKSQIIPQSNGLSVRVYDAPASGYRNLLVEVNGQIIKYQSRSEALAGIRIYEDADKQSICDLENKIYLEAAETGTPLIERGIVSLVRFESGSGHVYATFNLPRDFVTESELKIIGLDGGRSLYSRGWITEWGDSTVISENCSLCRPPRLCGECSEQLGYEIRYTPPSAGTDDIKINFEYQNSRGETVVVRSK